VAIEGMEGEIREMERDFIGRGFWWRRVERIARREMIFGARGLQDKIGQPATSWGKYVIWVSGKYDFWVYLSTCVVRGYGRRAFNWDLTEKVFKLLFVCVGGDE
jgi:hypothetical protein